MLFKWKYSPCNAWYILTLKNYSLLSKIGGTSGKEPSCKCRRHKKVQSLSPAGLIPESGASSAGGHWSPLQYSCLENPMDREAWRAMFHRVPKRWTLLKWRSTPVFYLTILLNFKRMVIHIYIHMYIYIRQLGRKSGQMTRQLKQKRFIELVCTCFCVVLSVRHWKTTGWHGLEHASGSPKDQSEGLETRVMSDT